MILGRDHTLRNSIIPLRRIKTETTTTQEAWYFWSLAIGDGKWKQRLDNKPIFRCHYESIQSVQSLSCVWLFATLWTAAPRPPCPSLTPRACSNSCPLSRRCHPAISSSVIPSSSNLQSFPAPGSFQISQLSASGGQSIGVSASASVLPMNTQDWSPLGWTAWVSLQSKGLSRVFSNTTVQKHRFFRTQLSL